MLSLQQKQEELRERSEVNQTAQPATLLAKHSQPNLLAKYHSTQSQENLRETTARRINKNKPN